MNRILADEEKHAEFLNQSTAVNRKASHASAGGQHGGLIHLL
jgi:hypothetical protein